MYLEFKVSERSGSVAGHYTKLAAGMCGFSIMEILYQQRKRFIEIKTV
jgi:hypothetical protein